MQLRRLRPIRERESMTESKRIDRTTATPSRTVWTGASHVETDTGRGGRGHALRCRAFLSGTGDLEADPLC
jgi:hypothetical protein